MAGRSDYSQSWMKMSTSYYQDPGINMVSVQAEVLFVRMLALTKQTGSEGLIFESQLPLISRGLRGVPAYVRELVHARLLTGTQDDTNSAATVANSAVTVASNAAWRIQGYTKWYGSVDNSAATVANSARSSDVSAGQDAASRARPRAREREKEREREDSVRSSGTERTESAARAAPLAGGAAARHAQIAAIRAPWDPPEADTVDAERAAPSPENAKLIRAAIDKGYALPGSKGKPAKLWKYERTLNSYDPDGPPPRIAPRIDKPDAHPAHIRSVMQDTIDKLRARGYSDEDMGLRSDFDPGDPQ